MTQEELNKVLDSLGDNAYSMIRKWLFDKANSFSPDVLALYLHKVCNALSTVITIKQPDYWE